MSGAMGSRVVVRLSDEELARLDELARKRGTDRSEVVRAALGSFAGTGAETQLKRINGRLLNIERALGIAEVAPFAKARPEWTRNAGATDLAARLGGGAGK